MAVKIKPMPHRAFIVEWLHQTPRLSQAGPKKALPITSRHPAL